MNISELRDKLANIAEELAEQDLEQVEEADMMPKTLKCKECGDMLGNPTTDCPHDSQDPAGPNWIMVDVDNDGDMDMAVANEEEFAEEDDLELEEADIEEVAEEEVEETVEIPVSELNAIMQLAGFDGYKQVDEYANEPEEEYMDIEDQVIGLSGGLNGPKDMHTPAAGGDNPMDKEALKTVEESLYKSYKSFLEEAEIEDNA